MKDEVKEEQRRLDTIIQNKFGTPLDNKEENENDDTEMDIYTPTFEPMEETIPEADDYDPQELDEYISAQVQLPKGNDFVLGTVLARKRDIHGTPIGKAHANPILDTRIYEVQFPDGHIEEYAMNLMAECLYSQVDQEGHQHLLIHEIIDHEYDSVEAPNEPSGPTMKGWKMCVLWKDGSTSWEKLKDLKNIFPIQVAEYAIAHHLQHHLAFKWWVPHTMKKENMNYKSN